MSGRFVRASSYRHVHGTAAKAEQEFTEVKATTTGEGNFIAANEKFFCYAGVGGGGPVVVHPLNKPGRFGATVPTLSVHKDTVLDFEFSPFINTLLGTASEDGLVKVSAIPEEGLKTNITESLVSLEGHERKVNILHFHPTANNILATASADLSLRVWDIEKQAQVLINNDFGDVIQSFDWNPDGSLLVATAKDGQIRVYDPRNADAAQKGPGFSGSKASRALWMGDKGKIIAVGASKQSARQYAVWDARALQKPLTMVDIDTSAGVLVPFYDPDNSILYVAGKGDGNIRYFEIVDTEPYVHFLSEYRDNQSQKGVCFLPKKAVDVTKCEIAVALRLLRDRVVPVSFQVPRKSDMFQKDLYPDSYAGIPSVSADEWLSGVNKAPKKISMKPGDNKSVSGGAETSKATLKPQKSAAQLETELETANRKIAELEQQVAKLKAGK